MQHDAGRSATGSVARPGRLRLLAPLVTLLIPLVLGAAAGAIWTWWPCGTGTCARPLAATWVLVACALPTSVLWGLPWTASPITLAGTLLTSVFVWLMLGRWAATRATRDVDARWRNVVAELLPMLLGLWAGLLGGIGAVTFLLTR